MVGTRARLQNRVFVSLYHQDIIINEKTMKNIETRMERPMFTRRPIASHFRPWRNEKTIATIQAMINSSKRIGDKNDKPKYMLKKYIGVERIVEDKKGSRSPAKKSTTFRPVLV